ncbi:MAG TPA: cyclic 2,3-diphosphoglycerate synthase [Candidatus Polarisedimenticolia bacterium]|jgi:predicted GTPase|nr:cyclic 2,3-diphosphoglycerate synthase [Candidatus Polarisedimenticolia bacterium]
MSARRVLIMGAAGRDFHNFNVAFRTREDVEVVGFTATQIPNIAGRKYPAGLAGARYPQGIPIFAESDLEEKIRELKVDDVVFAYSDVSHQYVMLRASRVLAAGADFRMLGADSTMLPSRVPVISVCAVRTGSGKSQTTRLVCKKLSAKGRRVVAVRHPMPYGDLEKQRVQRFATLADLDLHRCTIEEREEYEPHIKSGTIIYAGVDYEEILRQAEKEADVIVWDGGNNDLPFFQANLEIVVADPLRPGHEMTYHPGTTNLFRAGCVVINKIDAASPEGVARVRENIRQVNPRAVVIEAASPLTVEDSSAIAGKRVLVVEDGPTLTHGEMKYGAGVAAAWKFGAAQLVDPRPFAVGSIRQTFAQYPEIGTLLPAVGYGESQMNDLRATIDAADCDLVIIATPIDLRRTIPISKPALRVTYDLQEIGKPDLDDVLSRF